MTGYYFWSAIINALTSFSVSFLVLHKNPTKRLNLIFVIFAISVGFWAACYAVWVWTMTSASADVALFWIRLAMVGSTLIPPSFTEFIIHLLGKESEHRIIRLMNLIFGVVIIFFSFNAYFIQTVEQRLTFAYWPVPGPLFYAFHLWFALNVTVSHYLMIVWLIKEKHSIVWKRNFSVLLGTLIGFLGGMTNHFLWYNIKIPPVGNILVAVYVATVAFSIVKYQLLDIKLIIKRTLVFAGVVTISVLTISIPIGLTQMIIGRTVGISPFFLMICGIAASVFIYRPVEKILTNITDKFLFQKKYDYHKLLKENAKQIAFIHSLDELAKQVSAYLVKQGRIRNAGILMRTNNNEYDLRYPLGYGGRSNRPRLTISENHPVIRLLTSQNGPITAYSIEKNMKDERLDSQSQSDILNIFNALKAEALIPSFIGQPDIESNGFNQKISNVLVLGGKKSDEPYTSEDLDVFFTIAQDSAIATENTRLVNDIVIEREEKVKAQKIAEQVNFTRSLKHEAGNKLVGVGSAAINMRLHLPDRVNRLKNKLKDKLTNIEARQLEEIDASIVKYSRDIEGMADRVKLVVDSVVGALAGDKNMKQVMDFRVPWETAKRNLNIDDTPKFKVTLSEGFKLFGNVYMMEQVFENLFKNSIDALAGQPNDLIYLTGSERDNNEKPVTWFEYWDEGPGVPESLFDKVFSQGFSTKPKPQSVISMDAGHGQGLYVCRKIIEEFHGGKIWLEKRLEGGSKFVFWLPTENAVNENRESES